MMKTSGAKSKTNQVLRKSYNMKASALLSRTKKKFKQMRKPNMSDACKTRESQEVFRLTRLE